MYDKGDSCSLTDVVFSRAAELVTANMRGQLKLFDLRSNQQEAAACFLLSNDQSAVNSLARHPTQVSHLPLQAGEHFFSVSMEDATSEGGKYASL